MSKQRYGRELWNRLCEAVAPDDTLPVSSFGGIWTARKLFFLCNYLEQTTRGMHGHPKFPGGMTYVDLFCGYGLCDVSWEPGKSRRYPGSALIAASTPKPFSRLLLIDSNEAAISATVSRVRRVGYRGDVLSWNRDANECIEEVVDQLPANALNVAFVDPFSLDIQFETVRKLVARRAMDLIVLFSDSVDIVRNVEEYYYPRRSPKLDAMLGTSSEWRIEWEKMAVRDASTIRRMFADVYKAQLAKLGYRFTKTWPLDGPKGPVYSLVYASKHELGLKYCEIALAEDFAGNLGLFGAM